MQHGNCQPSLVYHFDCMEAGRHALLSAGQLIPSHAARDAVLTNQVAFRIFQPHFTPLQNTGLICSKDCSPCNIAAAQEKPSPITVVLPSHCPVEDINPAIVRPSCAYSAGTSNGTVGADGVQCSRLDGKSAEQMCVRELIIAALFGFWRWLQTAQQASDRIHVQS